MTTAGRRFLTIIKVEPLLAFNLRLTLSSNEIVTRDLSLLAATGIGMRARLRDPKYFRRLRLVDDIPQWPGEVDFSPYALIFGQCPPPRRARRPALNLAIAPAPSNRYREQHRDGLWHVTVRIPGTDAGGAMAKNLTTARRRACEWVRMRLAGMNQKKTLRRKRL